MAFIDIANIQPHVPTIKLQDKIIYIHGKKGTWKTTQATKAPRHLLLGFEVGWNLIPGVKAIPIADWGAFKMIKDQLVRTPKLREQYDTIIIDTVENAYKSCYEFVCKSAGVTNPADVKFGKAWTQLRTEFEGAFSQLTKLGYGVIMLDHTEEFVDEATGRTTYNMAVNKKEREFLAGLCDMVLFTRKELRHDLRNLPNLEELASDPKNIEVYAYSYLNNENYIAETKSRARNFPACVHFSYAEIEEALTKAVESFAEDTGTTFTELGDNIRKAPDKMPFAELKDKVVGLAHRITETAPKFTDTLISIMDKTFNLEDGQFFSLPEVTENKYDQLELFYNELVKMSENIESLN